MAPARWVTNVRKLLRRRERGQVLMMAALLLPVLLGMAGMAVDVGSYASDRRQLQNAADSIALAAAQELPDEGDAQASLTTGPSVTTSTRRWSK